MFSAHAEARLARKLDVGSKVFVTRVNKRGDWRLARPCPNCFRVLWAKGVQTIWWTTGKNPPWAALSGGAR